MKYLPAVALFLFFWACSSNEPTPPVKITDGAKYFPIADGDQWFFTSSGGTMFPRIISGDTTINGVVCKKIVDDNSTREAWTIDSEGFKTHLLGGILRFDPPLLIPFNLEQGKPFKYKTTVHQYVSDTSEQIFDDSGFVEFLGYVTKEVKAGKFSDVLKIHYTPAGWDAYDEYYARGVGLLDNGDYVLDSALIGGVWYGRDSTQ